MGLTGFFKKALGLEPVVETVTAIVDKVAGTDWKPEEKSKFIIDFMVATKHQSVPRRVIAFIVLGIYALCIVTWLVAMVASNLAAYYGLEAGQIITGVSAVGAGVKSDIELFMDSHVDNPFNIILSFYFLSQIIKR